MTELTPAHDRRSTDPKQHPHPHGPGEPCPGGCDDVLDFERRLDDGQERMGSMERDIQELAKAVDEVLDILRNAKGFFRVTKMIGHFLGWLALIGAPLYTLYVTIKTGKAP